jgi:hypothetical protein
MMALNKMARMINPRRDPEEVLNELLGIKKEEPHAN